MDPGTLSAIGLVGNIIQFIDWISSVIAIGNQIRRNGASDFDLTLEKAAQGLEHQVQTILTRRSSIANTAAEEVSYLAAD